MDTIADQIGLRTSLPRTTSNENDTGRDPVTQWVEDSRRVSEQRDFHPETGLATMLYLACLQALSFRVRSLRHIANTSRSRLAGLTASLSRLHAWGEDLCQGQLDACVAKSSALRACILEQLIDMGTAVIKGYPGNQGVLAPQHSLLGISDARTLTSNLSSLLSEAQRLIDPGNEELESDRDSLASSQESEANSQSGWTRDVRDSVDLLADTAPLIECLLIEDEVGNGRDGQPTVHADSKLIESSVPRYIYGKPPTQRPPREEHTYYQCCKCLSGPMLLKIFPRCTSCNTHEACKNCRYEKRY